MLTTVDATILIIDFAQVLIGNYTKLSMDYKKKSSIPNHLFHTLLIMKFR